MAFSLKETNKVDLKNKELQIINGKIYDDGEEINLYDILTKAFGEDSIFTLSATKKSEEDLELENSPISEDEE